MSEAGRNILHWIVKTANLHELESSPLTMRWGGLLPDRHLDDGFD